MLERIKDDRYEGGRADRCMRGGDDAFEIPAVSDIRREEGDSGVYYLFIGSTSLRDHGNAGGVLPAKCGSVCGDTWNSGDPGFRGGCGAACVEAEYAAEYCGGNCVLYVSCAGGILATYTAAGIDDRSKNTYR